MTGSLDRTMIFILFGNSIDNRVAFFYFPSCVNHRKQPAMWLLLAPALISAGCAVDTASIQIVERPNTLETRRYQETFDEACYDLSASGNLRLVFRKRMAAGASGDELTQTIVVETLWRSMPGITSAHRTQINGTVTYSLAGQKLVQNLSGAGSIFFEENKARDRLTGTLAYVTLESQGPEGDDGFLHRIELSGTFSASRNPSKAIHLANETKRTARLVAAQRSKEEASKKK